jgi:pimeloyl-ACP methyl ester carboxylesterase
MSRSAAVPRVGTSSCRCLHHNAAFFGEVITTLIAPRPLVDPAGSGQARAAAPQSSACIALATGSLAYTIAGRGEPLLLIHGLGGTRDTWRHLIKPLAATHTVIAPDLPGHGDSDAPAGDYSLGAHAAALRDLLVAMGYPAATIAGHSLGGGIGLQFAYQFPERTSRLILISSGGLGPQLTPMLRAATLPGADTAVAALARLPRAVTRRLLPAMAALTGVVARQDAEPVADALNGLAGSRRRQAFLRTARTVINWQGQTVNASKHLPLLADLPVLLAWGSDDRTIPPHHQHAVARQLPAGRAIEITDAGHYPHETAPDRLLPPLQAFLSSTPPSRYTETTRSAAAGAV